MMLMKCELCVCMPMPKHCTKDKLIIRCDEMVNEDQIDTFFLFWRGLGLIKNYIVWIGVFYTVVVVVVALFLVMMQGNNNNAR